MLSQKKNKSKVKKSDQNGRRSSATSLGNPTFHGEVDIFEKFRSMLSSTAPIIDSDQSDLHSPKKSRTPRATLFDIIVLNDGERFKSIIDSETPSFSDEIVRKKRTIIHWLAYYGRSDMLLYVLDNKEPNLNLRDSEGRTPLHLAASRGKLNCIKKMVEKGANWEVLDNQGLTAYQIAKGDKCKKYFMNLYDPDFIQHDYLIRTRSLYPQSSSISSIPNRTNSFVHQVGLHDQHGSRNKIPSSIFEAYENGSEDIFRLLIAEEFDFSQSIGEMSLTQYCQTHPVHSKNWNLFRQLERMMLEKVLRANLQFEDAIMFNRFRSYLQQNSIGKMNCSDLDRHLNTVLEGVIDEGDRPAIVNGRYLSEFAHGILEFYSILTVFNRIVERFDVLTHLAKLRALYLIKEIMLQDTGNRYIGNDIFKTAWKNFRKSIKTSDVTFYNSVFEKLNKFYEAKLDFYITSVPPLSIKDSAIPQDGRLTVASTRKGHDNQLVEDLAADIRQINAVYFLCLSPDELRSKSWQALNREELSPNSLKLTQFFDSLAKMVIYDIVALRDVKARAKRISFYLDVAFRLVDETRGLSDYHGAHAILSGLSHNTVSRLKETWGLVDGAHLSQKAKLENIFSPLYNFRNLRTLHERNAIPFLGVITRDLTFILDSNEPHNAVLLLGALQIRVLQTRLHLLAEPFQIRTDILQYISGLGVVTDEELYDRSRSLEEQILSLSASTALIALEEYLQYRVKSNLGIKIQFAGKVLKDKQAFNTVFEWLKCTVREELATEAQSRQILELCFSLLTSSPKCKVDQYIAQLFSDSGTPRERLDHDADAEHSPRAKDDAFKASIEKITHELEEIKLSIPVSSISESPDDQNPVVLRSPGRTPREKKRGKMSNRSYSSTLPKGLGSSDEMDSISTKTINTPREKRL
ncbi:MAG: RasGEF domain-containing protein [Gammaproteobacteria bacterium]